MTALAACILIGAAALSIGLALIAGDLYACEYERSDFGPVLAISGAVLLVLSVFA